MAKRKYLFDSILCVDLESTCWGKEDPPEGQVSDIIEIGVCYIDIPTKTLYTPQSWYVKPTQSTISEFCVELTKITQELLDEQGSPFLQTCHSIMETYKAKQRAWLSWGNYDRQQLERQCLRENVPFPFGETHWNMRDLYTVKKGLSSKVGLSQALEREGMAFIGQPHSGKDDAFAVARLFAKLVLGWENIL